MTAATLFRTGVPPLPLYASYLGRVRQLQMPVIRLLTAVTGDEDEAAVMALQVFVRVAQRRPDDEATSTTEVFREALGRIRFPSEKSARRGYRTRAEPQPEFDLPGGEIPEQCIGKSKEPQNRLAANLAHLPELRRNVLLLHLAAGLPADQIARVCDVSVKVVRQELESPPPVPRELFRIRSTVRVPWYFDAVLLQRLAGGATSRARRRWATVAAVFLTAAAIGGAAFVVVGSLERFRGHEQEKRIPAMDSSATADEVRPEPLRPPRSEPGRIAAVPGSALPPPTAAEQIRGDSLPVSSVQPVDTASSDLVRRGDVSDERVTQAPPAGGGQSDSSAAADSPAGPETELARSPAGLDDRPPSGLPAPVDSATNVRTAAESARAVTAPPDTGGTADKRR
jgi:DNA-directed RNA polymerase specialized sigma24 family protein